MQLFNYNTGEWEIYTTIEVTLGMNYRYIDTQDYIQHVKNSEVLIRFYHPMAGISPDDLFIDYVTLIR